jgi:hypothetical protein
MFLPPHDWLGEKLEIVNHPEGDLSHGGHADNRREPRHKVAFPKVCKKLSRLALILPVDESYNRDKTRETWVRTEGPNEIGESESHHPEC